MDFKQLEYFLKVCAAASLSDAAYSSGISQPALSRQIKLLEDELGVQLFERHSRGMVLSEAGLRLQPQAENLLRDAERIRTDLAAESATPRGELRIGTPGSLRRFLVTPALVRFMAKYPDVRFKIHEGTSRAVRDTLMNGGIDLAILSSQEDLEPFRTRRVASESLFLIGPRKVQLSMNKPVPVTVLAGLPLVLTARPNSLRVIVDRALQRHDLSVDAKIEVETLQMALDLIDTTGCYSIFPYCAIDIPLQENRITASPIEKLNISWTIATVRDRNETTAVKLFIDEMINESRRKIQNSEWHTAVLNA
jgi:LysR family transcriptional regulator, nitrogen assimilation regulatory protein